MIYALILFAVTYVLMLTFQKYRPYIALGSAVLFIVTGMLPLNEIWPAWRAITINPARTTGIADRVGSLEAGKDADVVVFSGDPLRDIQARAVRVFVDGEAVV